MYGVLGYALKGDVSVLPYCTVIYTMKMDIKDVLNNFMSESNTRTKKVSKQYL